jgi:hypothetical protein
VCIYVYKEKPYKTIYLIFENDISENALYLLPYGVRCKYFSTFNDTLEYFSDI